MTVHDLTPESATFVQPALVAIVLTYNEEANIERALRSIGDLCPIIVVDSGSTDQTEAICRRYTQHFLVNPYQNHASQWTWALENTPLKADWVLALDADFELSAELRQRLRDGLATVPPDVSGIFVIHRYVFGGADIRFGGAKKYWMRVVRRGHASPDLSDLVDFRFVVQGKTQNWNAVVREYNELDEDASFWIGKQDKFSLRLAVEEELRRQGALQWGTRPHLFGNADQRVMWLRDLWLRMPLFLRPCIYFTYRYFLRLGFLDGRGGFLYHAQQGFWMRLVVDWKLWQLRKLQLSPSQLQDFCQAMLKTPSGSVRHVWTSLNATGR